MRKLLIWLPLGMFLIFLVVFAGGLISPESKTIPSKLIGKPMPAAAFEQWLRQWQGSQLAKVF